MKTLIKKISGIYLTFEFSFELAYLRSKPENIDHCHWGLNFFIIFILVHLSVNYSEQTEKCLGNSLFKFNRTAQLNSIDF